MINDLPHNPLPYHSRRDFLKRSGMGLGMLGLGSLLGQDVLAASRGKNPMAPRAPQYTGKAKHVIHIFLNGGASQVDTFDPKPLLKKYAGKKLPMPNLRTERPTGAALPSPFKFKKYGQSGIEISELFADLGPHADEMCVIRSMHANVPNHEPSLMLMNSGDSTLVRPSMGSWVTYGLGTENQNLPGYISMCPGGYPIKGPENWRAAFLPGVYQGSYINPQHQQIEKLLENIQNPRMQPKEQARQLDFIRKLNQRHLDQRGGNDRLNARIQSMELAYRMQSEATDAFDIDRESEKTRERYGKSVQGRQLLMARRLVERGVRFVQLWHGAGQPWDNHDDLEVRHRALAGECSPGIGALVQDLKDRGLLDETLIVLTGEFGRTPVVEMPKAGANAGKINGRDHNHWGFSTVLIGGGIKGGTVYGSTDEFGFQAVENRVHVHDLHATILHLLGFDHTKLTYRYAGRDFRLTDVHGHIVKDIVS